MAVLAVISIVAVISCGKDTPLSPYVPEDSGKFDYKVNGLKDTSLERIGEVRSLIFVEKLAGKSETVLLTGEDLPEGMEVRFDPVNSEKPSFNTSMVIKNVRVKEGTYKIKIKGASATAGIDNYYINVTVLPYTNPADGLAGSFTETGACSTKGSVNDNVNIVSDDTVKNRIHIKGLFSGVMTNIIYANIDPKTNTLDIPVQTVNSVSYSGDGTYDDDKLIINYTVSGITINESCTSTITRN
ncbi:MAG: hypothetical protein KDC07_09940 [Chitinophagaceae bacterium]|nr:hypothetical protein [Chitinophagaceae bacterium]